MYTQCPKCETVFKMSAEVLRTAGGQVRCGQCGEVFNALARLAEDPAAFSTAESPLEMETRADRILESPPATAPRPAELAPQEDEEEDPDTLDSADVEFARLQVIDVPPEALEFSLLPTDLDRVFVEQPAKGKGGDAARPGGEAARPGGAGPAAKSPLPGGAGGPVPGAAPAHGRAPPRAPPGIPVPGTPAPGTAAPGAPTPGTPTRQSSPGKPATPGAASVPAPRAPQSPQSPRPAGAAAGAARVTTAPASTASSAGATLEPPIEETDIDLGANALPPHPESRAARSARESEPQGGAGGFVSEEVRSAMLAGMDETLLPTLEATRSRSSTYFLWLGAAVVLGGVLATQVFFTHRAWFARAWGVGGGALPNLSVYQQQVWGVTGEPGASGTLRVRASLMNASAQLQPYPLLRITLTDRFGNRIGSRDFAPAEYLGKPMVRMLAPGERVDATLDIQDPGKDAEGYELDVCLRAAERVVCAADAAPQGAK